LKIRIKNDKGKYIKLADHFPPGHIVLCNIRTVSPQDLCTVTAVAKILGKSKQYIQSYIDRGTFPTPDQYIFVGEGKQQPVWFRSTIEKYKADRSPG